MLLPVFAEKVERAAGALRQRAATRETIAFGDTKAQPPNGNRSDRLVITSVLKVTVACSVACDTKRLILRLLLPLHHHGRAFSLLQLVLSASKQRRMTSLFGLPELAEASSSLSVSASDSSATYVENDHTPAPRERDHDYSGQTLKDFFAQNHRSPPDKLHGGNIHLRVVIQSCNKLLCPRNISWQNLDRDQQIKMAFLYSRRQEKWIKKHLHKVKMTAKARELMADMLLKALDPTTREGQRLEAFVRKGGDLVLEPAANDEDHYEQFLDKFLRGKTRIQRLFSTSITFLSNHSIAFNTILRRFAMSLPVLI